jgi:hypothetical protein
LAGNPTVGVGANRLFGSKDGTIVEQDLGAAAPAHAIAATVAPHALAVSRSGNAVFAASAGESNDWLVAWNPRSRTFAPALLEMQYGDLAGYVSRIVATR